ncbi:CDP-glucose 4,6-dehydratase [Bradyrhizobium yuanmingense]|uniref:CDP-glucose 4,6-dehydratase n=1 Tax=Bradyrhizobium yuanmingense TaxID=108015 RepID=UPI0035172A70
MVLSMTGGCEILDFELTLKGERIFVTGHTGFTGGWLVSWLKRIGCDVAGLALEPATTPSLFAAANIADGVASSIGDIRDLGTVCDAVACHRPSIIIHLAAQPLVSKSFADPIETFATNALGTAHVLEAARLTSGVKAVVCITTDKVYRDQDWVWGYREQDPLGGKDPYSASKACAELVAASYRATLAERGNCVLIANARGGNIIGGGDWSADRIVRRLRPRCDDGPSDLGAQPGRGATVATCAGSGSWLSRFGCPSVEWRQLSRR